jgi:hypothetical protein
LHQKTFLVEGYLQDMVGHDVVAVGHDVIGIHPTGKLYSIVFVNSSYLRLPLRHDFALF